MTQDQLSLTFSALGDPTRRAILVRLSQGEASVSDLAEPFMKTMTTTGCLKKWAKWYTVIPTVITM